MTGLIGFNLAFVARAATDGRIAILPPKTNETLALVAGLATKSPSCTRLALRLAPCGFGQLDRSTVHWPVDQTSRSAPLERLGDCGRWSLLPAGSFGLRGVSRQQFGAMRLDQNDAGSAARWRFFRPALRSNSSKLSQDWLANQFMSDRRRCGMARESGTRQRHGVKSAVG